MQEEETRVFKTSLRATQDDDRPCNQHFVQLGNAWKGGLVHLYLIIFASCRVQPWNSTSYLSQTASE